MRKGTIQKIEEEINEKRKMPKEVKESLLENIPPSQNSRIPYRDPWVKPEYDIIGNSKIPKPCVIPRLYWGIS